jgi:hypothetical protein
LLQVYNYSSNLKNFSVRPNCATPEDYSTIYQVKDNILTVFVVVLRDAVCDERRDLEFGSEGG